MILTPRAGDAANVVGSTAGQLNVASGGSATYTIPITVPTGTAGMQPKVSLTYNSSAGPGLLGIGWNLDGLSAVTRCPRTLHQDGEIEGVEYDQDDRFCLNGARLVAVNGTYGADGTEYRTEYEEFSQIFSYGSVGGGPEKFEVRRKSGEMLEFGYTADSRIEVPGSATVRLWSLSSIIDNNGNYVDFSYIEDNANGEFRIDRIDYTGNAAAGLAPYNTVQFNYEPRPRPILGFEAGAVSKSLHRLTDIVVNAEGSEFRTFTFTYESGAGGRSRLASLQECAGADCFPATTFEWTVTQGAGGWQRAPQFLAGHDVHTLTAAWQWADVGGRFVDLNGDGLQDFFFRRDYYGSINEGAYLNTGDGWEAAPQFLAGLTSLDFTSTWQWADAGARFVDLNGDGLQDFFYRRSVNGAISENAYLNTGNGWQAAPQFLAGLDGGALTAAWQWGHVGGRFVDLNGDGLQDFIYRRHVNGVTNEGAYLNTGNGWQAAPQFLAGLSVHALTAAWQWGDAGGHFVDLNGDGLQDFFFRRYYYGTIYEGAYLNTGNGWESAPQFLAGFDVSAVTAAWQWGDEGGRFVDLNGDGLEDFFYRRRANGVTKEGAYLNTGNGWQAAPQFLAGLVVNDLTAAWQWADVGDHFVDLNGDGLQDFFYRRDYPGIFVEGAYLNTGNGWEAAPQYLAGLTSLDFTSTWQWGDEGGRLVDLNGDGIDDFFYRRHVNGAHSENAYLNTGATELLSSVTNGLGLKSDIAYKPLTDPSVYTKGSGASYPDVDVVAPIYVVSQIAADDGLGGQNANSYTYEALRAHQQGRGNLGFAKMTVTDEATGIKTVSTYSQDYANHHEGLLLQAQTIAPGGTVLSDETRTWAVDFLPSLDAQRCFRYSPQSVTTKRDLNGALLSTVTEDVTFDAYGNPTQVVQTTQDGPDSYVKTTDNVYANDTANWFLGRLTGATVTHARSGQLNIVRSSAFTYAAATGQLLSETIEPGDPLFHTKTYTHNAFGGVLTQSETWGSTASDGLAATSRTTTFAYDAKGRYRVSEANPLGHAETMARHPLTGLVTSRTGPNGLTTTWAYDAFGRVLTETRADGNQTTTSRTACGTCPANGAYVVTTQSDGAPPVTVYKDKLNRELRVRSVALDGSYVHVDTQYDALGRVTAKSEPYFDGDTPIWTTVAYDLLGRPTLTTNPDGSTQSVVYNGLERVSTNELGQTKTVRKNALGEAVEAEDDLGGLVTYTYDAIGQLVETEDPAGNLTTATYDLRGNKTAMSDPDKGNWTYDTNALGLLVEQTDAKGQTTRFTYDALGRALTRIDDADAPNPQDRTATWIYDTGTKGIGKPAEESQPSYTAAYSYDSFGRPSSTTRTIDFVPFTSSTTYDGFGRVEDTTYPSGLVVSNLYNADGHLVAVTDAAGTLEYWRALEQDARGNIQKFHLGNGIESTRLHDALTGRLDSVLSTDAGTTFQDFTYDFDDFGNLTAREDLRQGYIETFLYDGLNRLTTVNTLGGVLQTVTLAYGPAGTIQSKSDVGSYTYAETHPGTCGSGHAGPHAVTTAGGATYCYDLNGNMTSGDGRAVAYSAFDKPVQIAKGLATTYFRYGPDRARFQKTEVGASGTTVTTYIGGAFYEEENGPSGLKKKHYIAGVAVLIDDGTGTETHYLLRDHLGSVETITDETATVIERTSFDAWGKRRDVDWTALANPEAYVSGTTPRGFTGHEMLDSVGLVHMGGRVYEPVLGRFLTADPFVQDATNSQALDRYSYVLNNPLSYTDPSGFFFKKAFKGGVSLFSGGFQGIQSATKIALQRTLGKALVKVPYLNTAFQIAACANPAAAYTCPAYAVAATMAVGGSLGDAVIAGSISYASVYAFGTVGTHGALVDAGLNSAQLAGAQAGFGFAATLAQGGSVREGVIAAAAGAASGAIGSQFGEGPVGSAARIATGAVIGGLAAEAAGGSFANGAATGAFAALFGEIVAAYYAEEAAQSAEAAAAEDLRNQDPRERQLAEAPGVWDLNPSEEAIEEGLIILGATGIVAVGPAALTAAPTAVASAGTAVTVVGSRVISAGRAIGQGVRHAYNFVRNGWEFKVSDNLRVAPFGNRAGPWYQRLPHYHRRVVDSNTGKSIPGQGIGRHRPWQSKNPDNRFLDRL